VLTGAVLLPLTLNVAVENQTVFLVLLSITALFIPLSSANVIATVFDVTLPEVRSTALAVQYFIERAGGALAPVTAGLIAVRYSLQDAILWTCVVTWLLSGLFLAGVAYVVPRDIATLRSQLHERAEQERARHPA
jgi:hypothetical protein